ncbi:MAG: hypothetical protein HZA63_02880 [Rhodocyclales bacterium]|nr:hypothetical protein [Rhodocyclales bacterium]
MLLWIVVPFVLKVVIEDPQQRGLFGDSYGALNALFSGLAFAGVIATLLLQRQELSYQREELELTRAELQRAASAQEATSETIAEQAEVMKVTAHLSGLAALLDSANAEVDRRRKEYNDGMAINMVSLNAATENQRALVSELENLMHGVRCAATYGESVTQEAPADG